MKSRPQTLQAAKGEKKMTRSGFARYCGSSCMAVKQPWRPKMAPQIPKAHPAGVISVG